LEPAALKLTIPDAVPGSRIIVNVHRVLALRAPPAAVNGSK
jgi:hypothetical protein